MDDARWASCSGSDAALLTHAIHISDTLNNGTIYHVNFHRDVILSAGAIGSASILMQSGIGPRDGLESQNVRVPIVCVRHILYSDTCSARSARRPATERPRRSAHIHETQATRDAGHA